MSDDHNRSNFASGSVWEPLRGYSRAVKVGDRLFISGTTALSEKDGVLGGDSAYEQTKAVIKILRSILRQAKFSLHDVVRTRLYITDMSRWKEYATAHREAFENIRPASTLVQVVKLVDPRLLIEMEVEAVLGAEKIESIKLIYD